MICFSTNMIHTGVNISKRKNGTKQTKKLKKQANTHLKRNDSHVNTYDETCTKAPSGIFGHLQSAQLDFALARRSQEWENIAKHFHGPFSSLVGSKGLTRDIHILGCRRSCRRCFKFQTGKTHKIIQTDTRHDRCEIRKKAGRLTGKREIPHKSGNVETRVHTRGSTSNSRTFYGFFENIFENISMITFLR